MSSTPLLQRIRSGGAAPLSAVVDRASVDLSLVPDFSPGLEGVVAAETSISEVDGANGRLIYRGGYLIEDLAPATTFEEVAYLLWHGELPTKVELDALKHQMSACRNLTEHAQR
ncbi:MAG: citrate synthase, partial [Chloroflexota bacterium]|nr:citrate synthase [Chloroflexota bacterium]